MQICLDSPLPSFDSIAASFRPLMTWPPKFPSFPKIPQSMLPGMPSPMFPTFHVPNFELMVHAIELQAFQLQTTILGMVRPILAKLGIALDAWLPKIPGLPGLNLLDLIAGDAEKLIAAVWKAIAGGFHLPSLPNPIYATLRIPEFEALQALQHIVANYMSVVASMIPSLIKKLTDKFKWPGLPRIPSLPTTDALFAMVRLPKVTGQDFDAMSIVAGIGVPGIPSLPRVPLPMMFSFKMPDVEFVLALNIMYNHFTTGFLKPIMDFILNTLSRFLSFTFPKLCIGIPGPAMPALPAIKIPTVVMPPVGR